MTFKPNTILRPYRTEAKIERGKNVRVMSYQDRGLWESCFDGVYAFYRPYKRQVAPISRMITEAKQDQDAD